MEVRSYDYLKVKEYTYWTLYVHNAQNYLGRCYIALNRQGALDPFRDTTRHEKEELETIILKVQRVLDKLYRPELYNYANFRNTWLHCHWHIIPRYKNPRFVEGYTFIDKNWGKNYAPYDRNFKIPDNLLKTIKENIKKEINNEVES